MNLVKADEEIGKYEQGRLIEICLQLSVCSQRLKFPLKNQLNRVLHVFRLKISQAGFSPLNTDRVRYNEKEVHLTNHSQQHAQFQQN